jgi:hypothetical protein
VKRTASITVVPTVQEWSGLRKACTCPGEVATVPDTSPGMPRGATRSETAPCTCGGVR